MPQYINMSNDPIEDFDKINETINSLENYGIIHEEVSNDIRSALNNYISKDEKFEIFAKSYIDDFESESIDYYDSFQLYCAAELGELTLTNDFLEGENPEELKLDLMRMFREIFMIRLYSDYSMDEDEIVTKAKNNLGLWLGL